MRSFRWAIAILLALTASVTLVSSALAALPPGVAGTVTPQQRSAVIGRDKQVTVNVELPDSCAGTSVQLRLYQPPTDGSNALVPVTAPALAAVSISATASAGSFPVVVPLPAALAGDPVRVWPGVSGNCLAAPVYDSGAGIDLAKLDAAENPGTTSTIVVYGPALKSTSPTNPDKTTLGDFTGSLTVMANGVACTTANVGKGATTDASGNVRIHLGTAGQPAQCSTAGAAVTFVRADGATLYEKRTLLPGVTQQLQNLAPEAVPDGPGPTATITAAPTTTAVAPAPPAPPNTGSEGPSSTAGSRGWLIAVGGLAILAAAVCGAAAVRRRQ
ncbi:MAG TPA: hypothetical protein VN697_03570 [Tepidiformaceae bacterium]|nr:hypothetical protein [Tepidiformaceae bacterium]